MILYKGSKLNINPFQPQPIHPDDYHKFPKPIPEKAIFASESETKAKIFATFSTIITFEISTTSNDPRITITLGDKIDEEVLKDKVYIYKFDSEQQGWKYIEESREWYNTEQQIPIEIQEYSRETLYKELRENPEIIFKEDFKGETENIS
ncbi:MAG: hypothetical protein RBS01_01660 [Candidatus Dojkabacteria bacterium]|jgi:hypothetical protein|nr:hypothetical protein [Candidatus Dojkabacteria bacterium]